MQDYIFYNRLTGVCIVWRGMAGGRAQCRLHHDGHVVMIFCCFVWLAWKKKRNTRKTVQEEIQPAELLQFIFCAGFYQSSINKHHHKEQWYYEFPIMYASLGFNQSSTRSPHGTMVL